MKVLYKILMLSLVFLSFFVMFSPSLYCADMNDYCLTPPFIVAGVKPNLLMMIDNSASMYDLTYISNGTYCYDDTYDDTATYVGYFDQNDIYEYDSFSGKFVGGTVLPGTCTYITGYLCIDMSGAGNTRAVDNFIASGKFLNWLSASKFDVQKAILTGGKYDTANNVLIGESRGCVGRRFVRELPALPGVTFAIRGPNAQEPDFVNVDTQGGTTRIEIYEADFNQAACMAGAQNWVNGNYGQASVNTANCLGVSGGGGTASGRILAVFNNTMQTCWLIRDNIDNGRDIWLGVNIQDIQTLCGNIYLNDGILPDTIIDEKSGDYICSSVAPHLVPTPPYDSLGIDALGFVGLCWQDAAVKFTGKENCVKKELLHWCYGTSIREVIDPSEGGLDTGENWNIPAVLMDAGVRAVGDPVGPSGSTDKFFYAKVSSATAPEGLIQEFSSLIRFGAMSFSYNGSSSECGLAGSNITCPKVCSITTTMTCALNTDCPPGEGCVAASNYDGGQVIHHIGYAGAIPDESVGDHTSGLIHTIDEIKAWTWTPFAEGFYNAIGYFASRTDLRLNAGDFDETKPPSQYRCQKNNILLITDGMSTGDLESNVNALVTTYNDGDGEIDSSISATCPKFAGSRNLDDLAWLAHNRNIRDFTETPLPSDPEINKKTITTLAVYNGGISSEAGECNPDTLMNQTAVNGGGTYQRAENPQQLYTALRQTFQTIAGWAASGTAASVLATGEGSGANLVQAIFYPEISISGTEVDWVGTLKNLWYFIDPRLGNTSIREDTVQDQNLYINNDYITNFYFDTSDNLTKANLFTDSDGDGVRDSAIPTATVYFEDVKSLWEAGRNLWARIPNDRIIYTTTDGSTRTTFVAANASTLKPFLQASSDNESTAIIRYVRGEDTPFNPAIVGFNPTYRNRTVSIAGTSNTLKLGDIVNSTPRLLTWVPMNNYYKTYLDDSYKAFTETADYKIRGMVFSGANDGMLHAFKFGNLELFEERYKKALISGADLGKEQWAFIPKNVLPYLQYLARTDYCHLFLVDSTPFILDTSIGTSGCVGNYWDCSKYDATGVPITDRWKTVIIGGMRQGGACKNPTDGDSNGIADACTKDLNGDGTVDNDDCVLAPASDNGYSSYFALDITNPNDPQVLWEFSNQELGFSTTGPAVVRISAKTGGITDNRKNGRWFVVFGSGPTGPMDKATHQFKGYSDQNAKIFILDLATGQLLRTIDSGISNAFIGSMINAPIDFDQNDPGKPGFYQDEALYFGFVKAENNPPIATTKWNVGGVFRLLTKNSLNPDDWDLSKVIEDVGPITSAVTKLQNYKNDKVWLFWGTGRYFFKISNNIDDADNRRSLYGVNEKCYSSSGIDFTCSTTVTRAQLGDANAGASSDPDGWYIDLDDCTTLAGVPVNCADANAAYKTERSVTDPLATPIGAVFFTTTKPSADVCGFGGLSHLWAVNYNTGGAVSSSILRGRALLQVSTGSIEEVELKSAFTERAARRTAAYQGVPPSGTPPGLLIPPNPVNKIIHMREK